MVLWYEMADDSIILHLFLSYIIYSNNIKAHLVGVVEDTDCFSAEGKSLPHNKCPGYGTKQSDREGLVMLELWGMRSTPSLPSLPGPLWPGVVAPDKALFMGQRGLNYDYAKLNCLK